MENHPIPQDVTGFQFKLIGNMTIKQFAYLATGIILAWLFLQLPLMLLIKIPLCSLFAFLGIGLAYVPIGGRPMDVMIGNFIKALFRPTQFLYDKSGAPFYSIDKTAIPKNQQTNNSPSSQNNQLKLHPQPTKAENHNLPLPSQNTPVNAISLPNTNPILISNQNTTQNAPKINGSPKPTNSSTPPITLPATIESKNTESKKELGTQSTPFKNISPIPRSIGANSAIPSMPDSPSLVVGATKDPRGNALPGILIEIKDKDGNPIRAFKTNEFGRFASATPLANGAYTIEFEDPKSQNKFEIKTINVTGQIIPPIVAVSIDTREELRRSLFQNG
ncbi:MAG: PrgI family protein [Candidatus Levybacteria bacterium]|nr:PrgI family protein [Candidatus Levybacteria bacterium]